MRARREGERTHSFGSQSQCRPVAVPESSSSSLLSSFRALSGNPTALFGRSILSSISDNSFRDPEWSGSTGELTIVASLARPLGVDARAIRPGRDHRVARNVRPIEGHRAGDTGAAPASQEPCGLLASPWIAPLPRSTSRTVTMERCRRAWLRRSATSPHRPSSSPRSDPGPTAASPP